MAKIAFLTACGLRCLPIAGGTLTLVATLLNGPSALAQRDLTDIPVPDPVAEQAAMKPAAEAAVNRFASDPDFRKPIQINFDSEGRLWVASSEVYPQIKPGERANDKIVVLEDTDGDGVSDRSSVFADQLLIPTGVIPDGNGGAYVASSTELLHFADDNGDLKADRRRVVLSGFGTEDTHHLLHTLRWGPDGCLYFNQSIYIHSHIETPYGTKHLEGGGIWRYRPETGELAVFCKGFVNPWGHTFDANGESFATDGAYFEGINYVFPDAVFVTSPGETRFVPGMNPGSPKHCGLEVLSGKHIPDDWSGQLVTSDFRGHRVCRFSLAANQSTYLSRQQPEILVTDHVAFRPIDARMGPDGALYVADWYNPIIQHGEVDFRDPRRDREHGRIWRVSFPGRPLDPWPDFKTASPAQLLSMLEAPSLAVRQFAREHLWPQVRKDPVGVLQAVRQWRDAASSETLKRSRALEHQWLGEVAGKFERDAFQIIVNSAADSLTRPSLRSAARIAGPDDAEVQAAALRLSTSEHLPSRFEAIVTLGLSTSTQAASALVIAAQQMSAPVQNDPLMDFALWQALRKTQPQWVQAVNRGELAWQAAAEGLSYAVKSAGTPDAAAVLVTLIREGKLDAAQSQTFSDAIAASGDAPALGYLLEATLKSLDTASPAQSAAALTALTARTQRDRTVPEKADQQLAGAFANAGFPADPGLVAAIVTAAGEWKAASLLPQMIKTLETATSAVAQEAILKALSGFDSPEAKQTLIAWSQAGRGDVAALAIAAIATKQPNQAAKLAAAHFAEAQNDAPVDRLFRSLIANKATAKALPEAIAKHSLPSDRARMLLSSLRNQGGNADIENAIRSAGKLQDASWKLSAELSQEILSLAKTGNPKLGEAIYRRAGLQCIQCHAIGDAGGLVGPNLISLGGSSQPDYILESLLDPNAKLKEGYNTLTVLTDDGQVTSGIPVGRIAGTLKLRLADGKEVTIPTDAIEDEQPGKSLMPAGLLDTLTKQELVDLVAFLSALGRQSEFTVSTRPFVRQFETLVYTSQGHSRINRTSIDTAATDDPALTWRPVTSQVNATLPLDELDRIQPHRDTPAVSYVRFDVVVGDGQMATLAMQTEAVSVWIDGKPTPPETATTNALGAGKHRIVVGIDRGRFVGDWSVEVR